MWRRSVFLKVSGLGVKRARSSSSSSESVRIGCASGFWGDTPTAASQLIKHGKLDFLVLDYLSEVTMSLLVAAQQKKKELGWCPDFVQSVGPLLPQIKHQGVKVVTNAGGVNPEAAMSAMLAAAEKTSTPIKIALVLGDDLLDKSKELSKDQCPAPQNVTSINAYLGAGPISRALDMGADIVITGRCTDSALALGPLVHKFKWSWSDFDLMAAGSLAGHLIECGAQATGGIFTDWDHVKGWENNGFPIAVCEPNGHFLITKPENTGGVVNRGTIAEQMVYEIGDPRSYILPDVVCDFSRVTLEERDNAVMVKGVKGRPPTQFYKAGGTFQDGWKSTSVCPIIGPRTREKGHKTAEAILTRCRGLFKILNLPDFIRTHVQVLGTEEAYGANGRAENMETRDGALWLSVHHTEKKALEIFAREIASAGTGMAPGLTTIIGGRPKSIPLLKFFSYLVPKQELNLRIMTSTGEEEKFKEAEIPNENSTDLGQEVNENPPVSSGSHSYKLSQLAWTRSGDKGNDCNIGVIARKPQFYPYILNALSSQIVAHYFSHKFETNPEVKRYELPGIQGLNFVLKDSLGGGGIASLNADPQGKGYAQMLADITINNVPKLL